MPYAIRLSRGVDESTHSFSQLLQEFSTGLFLIASEKKLLPGDNDCAFARFQTHTKFAREAAECGEHQSARMPPKARQGDALTCGLHAQRRMQMPRQLEARALRCIGLVAAHKRAQRIRFCDCVEPPFSGRFTRMAIMIATYQHHFNHRMQRSEGSEIVI